MSSSLSLVVSCLTFNENIGADFRYSQWCLTVQIWQLGELLRPQDDDKISGSSLSLVTDHQADCCGWDSGESRQGWKCQDCRGRACRAQSVTAVQPSMQHSPCPSSPSEEEAAGEEAVVATFLWVNWIDLINININTNMSRRFLLRINCHVLTLGKYFLNNGLFRFLWSNNFQIIEISLTSKKQEMSLVGDFGCLELVLYGIRELA